MHSVDLAPNSTTTTIHQSDTKVFKLLQLMLPNKIRITIWHFFNNYVPTLSNLSVKRVASVNMCPRCSNGMGTIVHDVRDCGFAADVWDALGLHWSETDATDTMVSCFRQYDSVYSGHAQNMLYHEGVRKSVLDIVTFVKSYLQELALLRHRLNRGLTGRAENGNHQINVL